MKGPGLIKLLAIGIIIIPFVSGCSLKYRAARNFLKNKQYIAAEQAYKNILDRKPNDPEALEGINSARESIIDKRLIEIRHMRLAGNHDEALEAFVELFDDEARWNLYPRGAIFFTQQEELKEALLHVQNIINSHLGQNHPVLARQYHEKYKNIFWQGKTLEPYKKIQENIFIAGGKSCDSFTSGISKKHPYFNSFANTYCSYWETPVKTTATLEKQWEFPPLFGTISLNLDADTLPEEIGAELSGYLQKALENSPFYDPRSAKKVLVKMSGRFVDYRDQERVLLTQEYTTQEPYTAYVPVLKSKQVPYEATELQMKWKSVPYQVSRNKYNFYTKRYETVYETEYRRESYLENVSVTKYRTELYTETEAVTKYKTIPHTYKYYGISYKQSLTLLLQGTAIVSQNKIPLSINKQEANNGISHNENIPDIGLSPKEISFISPVGWITSKTDSLTGDFYNKLDSLWADLFCNAPKAGASIAESGEAVHRCVRSEKGKNLDYIDQWYQTNLGISYSEADNIFKSI